MILQTVNTEINMDNIPTHPLALSSAVIKISLARSYLEYVVRNCVTYNDKLC